MSFVLNGGKFKLYTFLLFSTPTQPRFSFERMIQNCAKLHIFPKQLIRLAPKSIGLASSLWQTFCRTGAFLEKLPQMKQRLSWTKKKEQNYVNVFQKSLMRLASKSIRLEPLVRQTFLQKEKKSIHFCSGYREGKHFHKYTHAQLPCTKRLLFMFWG
jgi:hypothetical protein